MWILHKELGAISEFKTDVKVELLMDIYENLVNEVDKVELAANVKPCSYSLLTG